MARYGLYLNDDEDKDLIKHIEGKNSSAYLRNLVRKDLEEKRCKENQLEYESTIRSLSDNINDKFVSLERLIENRFYKLSEQQKSNVQPIVNNINKKHSLFDDEVAITGDVDLKL